LATLGAVTAVVPLPFVPSKMISAVRGSLVHDVVSRHGLCLTPDARQILSQADSPDPRRAKVLQLANFTAGRILSRFGPLTLLSPALSAIDTVALGILLDRYLDQARRSTMVRIQGNEARLARDLIDRAVLRCLDPSLHPTPESRADGAPAEDLRNDINRILDGLILGAASFPAWFVRRLEAAFDAVAAESNATTESP